MKIKQGLLKRIHVNQHNVRSNKKDGGNRPVFTVKTYKENIKGNNLKIKGESILINSPKKPLSCGATVWIECRCEVEIE